MTKIINCYAKQLNSSPAKSRRLNLKPINIAIFSTVFLLGFFYLLNISDLTVKGFALRELNNQAADLASQQLANEEKVNSLQSYYSLNSRTQKLNMVAIGDIEYLSASGPVVAKK